MANKPGGNDLRYCNNTGGSWSCTAADAAGGVTYGVYSSIAVDKNNVVHVSHFDGTNSSLRYCNNTGGSWSCADIDTSGVASQYSSIAVDNNDIVHISYYDDTNNYLRYCNNTGGSWSCTDVDTSNDVGSYSSIAIDSNNVVHISHYDDTNDNLRYCNNTGGSWSCTDVDTCSDVGSFSSIAIDSNNKVHISHYDATNDHIRYCNNIAGSWSCSDIGAAGGGPIYTNGRAIAIKKGRLADSVSFSSGVHMSYYNATDQDLIYAFLGMDSDMPLWSGNSSYAPATYSASAISQFNITWADFTSNVSTALLESNFSGSPKNYTMTNIANFSGQMYTYYNILPAGTFYWKS
jgi:hypothetical protein